jgi:ATP-dependent DNA helicase RecG
MTVYLETPITALGGLPPKSEDKLLKLGLGTVENILTHYPRRWEDRRMAGFFPTAAAEEPVCLIAQVTKTSHKYLRNRRGQSMFEAALGPVEGSGALLEAEITARWFNAYWVKNSVRAGQKLALFGKLDMGGKRLTMTHPDFEILPEDPSEDDSIHFGRITPVYRAGEGVAQRTLRGLAWRALQRIDPRDIPEFLPRGHHPLTRYEALRHIHFPEAPGQQYEARRRLALSEFYSLQMIVGQRRAEFLRRPGESHVKGHNLVRDFVAGLPFELTGAQRKVLREIEADMARTIPMNRMLQGDVGSGKTVVALCSMLLAVEAGFQAALMAPTLILAEQHYLNCERWLRPLGLRVALRTGESREAESAPNAALQQDLFRDEDGRPPDVVIGTHALFYDSGGRFERLGLVVIDEQHKFGVEQRSRLVARGRQPDVLVMTATPIPRTLALTLYGDLDVSTISERPAERGKIVTAIRAPDKLPAITDFMVKELEAGRQVYIVYPLIDESEKTEMKAAKKEFESWQSLLAPHTCGLLHGRLRPEEKEQVMRDFREGRTRVLVATTVVEVGVDVPNATVMLIENAERFGLAQLHQLRGRIGRGQHKSYCILLTTSDKPEALEKLTVLEKTSDGFEIAEADLKLRGMGDILGTAQSGLPPLSFPYLVADAKLMDTAREAARQTLEADPDLRAPENEVFRRLAEHYQERSLLEGG